MNDSLRHFTFTPTVLACSLAMAILGSAASAAENDVRLVPEVMGGTAGFEAGIAVEWRGMDRPTLVVRPEVLVNKDSRIGAGGAVLYDVSTNLDLPKRQAFAVGPRVVFHNSDRYGWGADAMATYAFDLMGDARAWRHSVGLLGAVGVIHDKEQRDNNFGGTVGAFYAYGF